ncbi:BlaI/MecI/CopY family transcriptional regulator [Hymenobacter rubripertinctus]|uniref:BlaI/MecI/CopY family transcriptional regulator n=1 Tax=Hymenobacter rubripertinctus TaxID=2029981 RepID=A0A418QLN3_9BACT|nr:BlaI/MecI/CopY family transcriptional regulator [Hymenobacter rubripertinctus]RIY06054.1 BlaI/MecI/CopY family transcriptional regulator [Hymenobacter rubripertinctus]
MENIPVKPTQAELEILQVLWQHGPATVRFVNEVLSQRREVGYTTTLKWLQLMTEKKLVLRHYDNRPHTYQAAIQKEETQSLLLDRFIEAAFGGSAVNLVLRAIGKGKNTREELDRIRKLLDQMDSTPANDQDHDS